MAHRLLVGGTPFLAGTAASAGSFHRRETGPALRRPAGADGRMADPRIDLNAATAEELDRVPGLRGHGFEIVRYREERGRFTSLRQLDEVPGLAGKTADLGEALAVDAPGRGT